MRWFLLWVLPAALQPVFLFGFAAISVVFTRNAASPFTVKLTIGVFLLIDALIVCGALWARRRLIRRLREAEGCLCPRCEFDLRGLADAGACPECGRPFDIKSDRARWRSFIAYDAR